MTLFAAATLIAVVLSPMILWLSCYLLARFSSVNLRGTLPWIRALRWITWIPAIPLFVAAIFNYPTEASRVYAFALISFSVGLYFPERWLRRRIEPVPNET